MGMVKEIFGDFASWRHKKEENDRLREANFKKMAEPGTYEAQLNYIRKRLTDEPIYQTFFVLDPNTGQQKFVTPIVYAESMNGTGAPPVVTADGKVIVKFQALLRSRYEHYSPFLNVGYLDTATGHITPIMDQSRTYGWHDSLLLVHDEQCQLSAAGRVLINTHQDNVNAMDLETLQGYGQPFCRNIHEPKAGEAVGIWATIFRGEPLPRRQGMARPRHGRLRRRLRDRHRRLHRRRQLLLCPDARDERRRRGHRVPDGARTARPARRAAGAFRQAHRPGMGQGPGTALGLGHSAVSRGSATCLRPCRARSRARPGTRSPSRPPSVSARSRIASWIASSGRPPADEVTAGDRARRPEGETRSRRSGS